LTNPRQQDQRWNKPVNRQKDHWEQAPAIFDPSLRCLRTITCGDEFDEESDNADGVENEKPNAKSICHNPFHDDLTSRNLFQDLGAPGVAASYVSKCSQGLAKNGGQVCFLSVHLFQQIRSSTIGILFTI
jgi:hypothetical protein